MCGIAGFIHLDPERPASREVIERMTRTLAHRGPDGEGFYVEGPVAFGHRRLSIIDIEGGAQPMQNSAGTLTINYNGEIYNYRELRSELEAHGHRHRTSCDTEVLLHAVRQWGTSALQRLNGMFAFALWNRETKTLTAARDRAGQKPLYWTFFDNTFLYASEPKAFFEYPGLEPKLSRSGLQYYLAYDYVPAPDTIYSGIYKLPAGSCFEWQPFQKKQPPAVNNLPIHRYWNIPDEDPAPLTKSTIDELRERLEQAMIRHTVADVPVGVFLSGGIDSSTVAGLLKRHQERVATFTIGFSDRSFDESRPAAAVAKFLKTDHHVHVFSHDEFLDVIHEIDRLTDEPFGDASLLPTYLLSCFARQHVKVALGGDGSDEMWAGYPTYIAHKILKYYRTVPKLLRKGIIEPAVRALPVSLKNFSFEFKAKRFIEGAGYPFPVSQQIWLGTFHAGEQRDLLSEEIFRDSSRQQLYTAAYAHASESPHPPLRHALEIDFLLYLADDILYKVDRAGMATSLEVRAPFLDTELLDFVWKLPDRAKMSGLRTKALLKRALADVLPAGILNRSKKGFGIPSGRWFRGPLRTPLLGSLEVLKQTGLFRTEALDRIAAEHFAGKFDHRKKLWTLFSLARWIACRSPIIPMN